MNSFDLITKFQPKLEEKAQVMLHATSSLNGLLDREAPSVLLPCPTPGEAAP